ncbi:MAG: glycosyltransferase family 4 protein [Oscillospiraceae bacterium]|nr:glycosyltransferase family 4 protein [Oscillospiraceae bacterium]
MKILVVCQYYYPENFQITPICEQLAKDGFDVTVLTGLPNYPTGIIPEEYKKGRRDELVNGVHVLRCHEVGRKKGPVHLAINYFSFVLSAIHKAKNLQDEFDMVFVYQLSPVLMAIPGIKYANKHRVPLVLYCCDLWPESMKMYIRNENNAVFKLMKRVSGKIYRSAQSVIIQSKSFLPYLREVHGIHEDKLVYIPAFADETYLSQDFTTNDDTVDFVFMGNLGIAQDLMAVLEAVYKIRETPGFKVHFVGDGAVLDEMKTYVASHGLDDIVIFYGRRPVEEMPVYYSLADACLVSLNADNQTGLTLPSKVQGYMAAGKPIIGMIDGSARDVIDESGCGICVRAGDKDGLADAMKRFVENREQFRSCGEKAREYFIAHFSRKIIMEKLESEFKKVVF